MTIEETTALGRQVANQSTAESSTTAHAALTLVRERGRGCPGQSLYPESSKTVGPAIDFTALPDSALLSDHYAASYLDIAKGTLSVWRSVGRYDLPFVKVGRKVRYRMGDLREFIKRRTRSHTGQGG